MRREQMNVGTTCQKAGKNLFRAELSPPQSCGSLPTCLPSRQQVLLACYVLSLFFARGTRTAALNRSRSSAVSELGKSPELQAPRTKFVHSFPSLDLQSLLLSYLLLLFLFPPPLPSLTSIPGASLRT